MVKFHKIMVDPSTESRINYMRFQLEECTPSDSFDTVLKELMEVVDSETDLDVNKAVEQGA